jgi:hypothetical protein
VSRGEAERTRSASQRRQTLEHRPRAPDDQLDRVVEADCDRAEDRRDDPVLAVVGVGEGKHDPDHQPNRAVLADPAQTLSDGFRPWPMEARPHGVEQPTVEASKHGGAG